MKQNCRMAVCAVGLMICLVMGSLLPVAASAKEVSGVSGSLSPIQAQAMQEFGAAASILAEVDGSVELIDGTAEKWIDRVILPDSIRALYDTLAEGSDNDGDRDILIEDRYYMDSNFSITVATETVPLNGKEAQEAAEEVKARYLPFLYTVFAAFDRDHPEVFWTNNMWQIGCSFSVAGRECSVSIQVFIDQIRATSYATEALIRSAISERDAAVAEICRNFTGQTTRYERISHFNEVLTKRNQYNTSSNLNNIPHDARECISALLGATGTNGPVCEGYARALKVLCDAENIPCVLVDGVASSKVGRSEAHMWNYVQMGDEQWYAVDVTWNDPGVQNSMGAISGAESEEYLLVGGNTVINGRSFSETHTVSNRAYDDTAQIIATRFINGPILQNDKHDVQFDIALNIPDGGYVYDGTVKEPSLIVKRNGVVLNPATDYTVQYANHKNAGKATVTVTGKGEYAGLMGKETFVIRPRELHPTVTVEDKVYDGTDAAIVSVSFLPSELLSADEDVTIGATGVFVSVFARKQTEVRVTLTLRGEDSANYTVENPTELYAEIKCRPITVYADALTTTTDDFEGLTYTIDPATPLVEGESLSGKLNFEETDTEGVYDIVQGTLTEKNNPNYAITFVSAKLTFVSEQTNHGGGQGGQGLGDLGDFPALLEQDWLTYVAIGGGAFVVVFVAIFAIVAVTRKNRRG